MSWNGVPMCNAEDAIARRLEAASPHQTDFSLCPNENGHVQHTAMINNTILDWLIDHCEESPGQRRQARELLNKFEFAGT